MRFELYKDSVSQYRWRLKASNGQIVAVSGEGYTTKVNCQNGIDLVKSTTNSTTVDDLT